MNFVNGKSSHPEFDRIDGNAHINTSKYAIKFILITNFLILLLLLFLISIVFWSISRDKSKGSIQFT